MCVSTTVRVEMKIRHSRHHNFTPSLPVQTRTHTLTNTHLFKHTETLKFSKPTAHRDNQIICLWPHSQIHMLLEDWHTVCWYMLVWRCHRFCLCNIYKCCSTPSVCGSVMLFCSVQMFFCDYYVLLSVC